MNHHLGDRSMPTSRRRESLKRRLKDARLAKSQYSQDEDELNLSITRSPDKWRGRMEPSSQVNMLYNAVHFPQRLRSRKKKFQAMQEAEIIMLPPSNLIGYGDGDPVKVNMRVAVMSSAFFLECTQFPPRLNSRNYIFQDMQEAEIIMLPPSNLIENVDGNPVKVNMGVAVKVTASLKKKRTQLPQDAMPIMPDRRNPPRCRVAPHRAGDLQPTQHLRYRRSRIKRRILNRNELNYDSNENQNNFRDNNFDDTDFENVNNVLQGNDNAVVEHEYINVIQNLIQLKYQEVSN